MRQALSILAMLALAGAIGCGKNQPDAPQGKGKTKSGLAINSKPKVHRGKDSPEELARAFQETLAANNAEAMMMLSLLGHGTNAWVQFSQATLTERRRTIETQVNALEAKPRPSRSDAEQARLFTLKQSLTNLEKTHAASFNALHTKLPADRKKFKEQEYLRLQKALIETGMVQDTMTLTHIDTTQITPNFLNANLEGGPLELHYKQDGQPLPGHITFNCAKLKNIGWVIVDPPTLKKRTRVGPQLPTGTPTVEPFPTPEDSN